MAELVRHSVDIEIAKHLEASNFCSGSGTTKNVPEKFEVGDLADLVSLDKIIAWNPPIATYEEEEAYGAMDTGDHPTIIKKYIKPGKGNISQWLQNKDHITRILTGSIGTIPNSEDWHWDDGTKIYEAYGILTESLDLELEGPGGKVIQSRNLLSTQVKATDGVASQVDDLDLSTKGPSSDPPIVAADISITLDTDKTQATLNIENFKFSCKMAYKADAGADHVLGSNYILEPTLQKREYEFSITTNKRDTNTWLNDIYYQATTQKFTAVLTLGSVATINMTDMHPLTAEEYNVGGRDRIKNQYIFKPTSTTVITETS